MISSYEITTAVVIPYGNCG